MMFMMVLFWGAIVGAIVWAVRAANRGDHHHHEEARAGAARPSDIARARYASGEIDREEFGRIIGDLQRPPPTKVKV
jgi:uncharacterized membrane protein